MKVVGVVSSPAVNSLSSGTIASFGIIKIVLIVAHLDLPLDLPRGSGRWAAPDRTVLGSNPDVSLCLCLYPALLWSVRTTPRPALIKCTLCESRRVACRSPLDVNGNLNVNVKAAATLEPVTPGNDPPAPSRPPSPPGVSRPRVARRLGRKSVR